MRLTTERKVFAGVLALAVAALGVDRLFLGGGATGPAAANAETTPVAATTTPTPAPAVTPHAGRGAAEGAVTAIPVAKQLAALQSITRDVDAFVPPSRWQRALDDAAAAEASSHRKTATSKPAPADEATRKFRQNQLTAILIEGGAKGRTARALIKVASDEQGAGGSRLYALGDELAGYRLVRIDAASVVFEPVSADNGGQSVTLSLPAPIEAGGIAGR